MVWSSVSQAVSNECSHIDVKVLPSNILTYETEYRMLKGLKEATFRFASHTLLEEVFKIKEPM